MVKRLKTTVIIRFVLFFFCLFQFGGLSRFCVQNLYSLVSNFFSGLFRFDDPYRFFYLFRYIGERSSFCFSVVLFYPSILLPPVKIRRIEFYVLKIIAKYTESQPQKRIYHRVHREKNAQRTQRF